MISKNKPDFFCIKKIDFVIKKKKENVMPKNLHDLVISQNRFFDIIKSIFFIKNSG